MEEYKNKFLVVSFAEEYIEPIPWQWYNYGYVFWPKSRRLLKLQSVVNSVPEYHNTQLWDKFAIKAVKGKFI